MFNPTIVSNLSDDELAALLFGINEHVNGGHEDDDTNIACAVAFCIGFILLIMFSALMVWRCKQIKKTKMGSVSESSIVRVNSNSFNQPKILNEDNKPFGNQADIAL